MHQVRYFLAVARVLNFTRAAEECHVAQPSLTRAIKQLEEEFGGELFRRERNLTHLSDLGHRMLPMMQQCFDSAQQAKTMAQSIKSGAVAPLSIGLSIAVNITLLISFLTELVRVFPGLELQFRRGTNTEIADMLKKGDAEVAVAGPLGETWERLDSWPLFTEPYRLAVSAQHALAGRSMVKTDDLKKQRLLCRTYCEHTEPLTAFLRERGVPMDVMHKVVSETDLLSLLGANIGVAIAPESSARSAGIKLLELEGLDLTRTVSVYAVAGRQRSTAANTLIKMLRAADWTDMEGPATSTISSTEKARSARI